MNKLKILSQKLKGNIQQAKGKIEVENGQRVKGEIDKVRGKTNIAMADIKNKI